ncbi:hypothetical protein [Bifidobacterium pseudocatenulatum]|uniref:hypothetical protein n=1 Tax=Bifidobacterium pseudocatenulatum TaxID=28026 RepID=UPI003D07CC69
MTDMALLWTVEYVGGALKVRRHGSQADAGAYKAEDAAVSGGVLVSCEVVDGGTARLRMVNRLERDGLGMRSRLMRLSLKNLVELTDEFCC